MSVRCGNCLHHISEAEAVKVYHQLSASASILITWDEWPYSTTTIANPEDTASQAYLRNIGILSRKTKCQDPMCINQKELKQNKISEMDGVYHHSNYSKKIGLTCTCSLEMYLPRQRAKMVDNLARGAMSTMSPWLIISWTQDASVEFRQMPHLKSCCWAAIHPG